MDRTCPGLDQYENHFGFCFLFNRDADRNHPTLAGERSYGPKVKAGPRELPRYSRAQTGVTPEKAVLKDSPLSGHSILSSNLRQVLAGVKRLLRYVPGMRSLDRYLRYRYTASYFEEPYPRGHYYSALPDIADVRSRAATLFREDIDLAPSIDLKPEKQLRLLTELAGYYRDFQWPDQPSHDFRFYQDQGYFGPGDAVILHAMLRRFKPKQIIEGGSGFTSALMLDTNERFFDNQIQFTFIEPFPERLRSLMRAEDLQRCDLVQDRLQNFPLARFQQLEANDILFVDSSHVAKAGSDVNFLLFEVLPSLKSGVIIHFHDVLWPFEYPLYWIQSGKAWNEAYLLRAFLQYNSQFEVLLLNCFIGRAFTSFMEVQMPRFIKDPGGSLWLRKVT